MLQQACGPTELACGQLALHKKNPHDVYYVYTAYFLSPVS